MSDTLLSILENERRYVARELHDGVAQTTLQLGLQAGICRKLMERGNLEMLADELDELEQRIQLASTQVRELVADMRRPQIEPAAELDEYIKEAIETHHDRNGPPVEYQSRLSGRFPPLSALQLLALHRIIQEALLNIRKHAQAKKVRLLLSEDDDNFYLVIADNGQGFDLSEVQARPIDKGGAGLANLNARVRAVGGSLTIGTERDADWTRLTLRLPKEREQPSKVKLSERLP